MLRRLAVVCSQRTDAIRMMAMVIETCGIERLYKGSEFLYSTLDNRNFGNRIQKPWAREYRAGVAHDGQAHARLWKHCCKHAPATLPFPKPEQPAGPVRNHLSQSLPISHKLC